MKKSCQQNSGAVIHWKFSNGTLQVILNNDESIYLTWDVPFLLVWNNCIMGLCTTYDQTYVCSASKKLPLEDKTDSKIVTSIKSLATWTTREYCSWNLTAVITMGNKYHQNHLVCPRGHNSMTDCELSFRKVAQYWELLHLLHEHLIFITCIKFLYNW